MFSPFTMGADSKYNTASTMSEIWINRPAGLSFFKTSWSSLACIGVSTAPGEIVLARIPSATNSMASARLNAGRVDLVMTGNEMGRRPAVVRPQSRKCSRYGRTSVFASAPPPAASRKSTRRHWCRSSFQILRRVFGESLGHINAGVVDEKIDAIEVFQGRVNHFNGRLLFANVTVHQDQIRRGF